jgi:hypothetical protein
MLAMEYESEGNIYTKVVDIRVGRDRGYFRFQRDRMIRKRSLTVQLAGEEVIEEGKYAKSSPFNKLGRTPGQEVKSRGFLARESFYLHEAA